MTIASVASDPTAHWRHETIAVPASGVTFSAINLVPKTLAVVVPLSVEFLEDAPNLPSLLENVIASAFALKIDRAGLYGIGAAAQPWGVLNWPGTNEIPTVGTPSDYSDVSQAITKIYEANFPGDPSSLAWIASPRDLGTYDALVSSSDDQPLQPTPWASKLQKYSTTSLEAAAGATSMVIGDFSQVLFAMRSNGITFEVLREGTVKDVDATEWNATSQLLVHLRAYMRLDTAVIKPQFLTKLTGVTAAG